MSARSSASQTRDCMFYSAILDSPDVHGNQRPDVVFVHGSGKDRASKLAAALRALDVRVDVIVDIDILNGPLFEELVRTLGGEPSRIATPMRIVRQAVAESRLTTRGAEVIREIQASLEDVVPELPFPREAKRAIERVLRKSASPRQDLKRTGEARPSFGTRDQRIPRSAVLL